MDIEVNEEDDGHLIGAVFESSNQPVQSHSCHNPSDQASSDTTTQSKQQHPDATELPSPSQDDEQRENCRDAHVKSSIHQFSHNGSFEDSFNFQGDLSDSGVAPQGARGHSFTHNNSHGDSLMLLGSMTTKFAAEMLKTKGANKRKEKADERKAALASSMRGVVKRAQ